MSNTNRISTNAVEQLFWIGNCISRCKGASVFLKSDAYKHNPKKKTLDYKHTENGQKYNLATSYYIIRVMLIVLHLDQSLNVERILTAFAGCMVWAIFQKLQKCDFSPTKIY